ncbi:MAG: NAD(P)/FAD-dependent oxidoreductase [Clostridia bacterium]|nr:NAD(P)/FAD-dependent oxidoreductase [Clostridia bacterium]
MNRYVIVGNGVAAAACIEGIRSADRSGEITVVSAENRPVYCRPLISYYLEGKTDLARMNYREESFYEENGCAVLYGRKAERIDPAAKTVFLDGGETLPYTRLCVAAGSSPFVPPFKGLDTVPETYSFMTLDDALSLERATETPRDVLIVGAGLIGLKCAEGLHARAKSITVCDLADRVLSSILDAEDAAAVQAKLEENGIRFFLGNSVAEFRGNTALMQNGETVTFDVLVLAVGVRANAALVKEAGGETGRGIVVDASMRTTLPDVYAAGDCAEGPDASVGFNRVLAILPNAWLQGYTAGVNMAGGGAALENAIPMNSIGFFGLHTMTAGCRTGQEEVEHTPNGYRRLYTENGYLKGFALIGETRRAGLYTSLIRDKVPLESIDFTLLKQAATSAAFSHEKRKTMFGGAKHAD